MPSTDEVYRLVPYRFFIDDESLDTCKLEKLTNLFPDMKAIIELELFKFNNLTRIIDRLSQIYTVSNAIDTRDDTIHLFLGPYHLSLGPAIIGALNFKNISTALLASSNSKKTTNDNINHSQKRRHDAILRRFRRGVKKLILIKSIIDKLRLASILTPYNQYELYRQGIYDLVLAGHIHNTDSMLNDESFIEQVDEFHSTNNIDKDTSLVASKYMKISALLHLITPTPHLHQTDNNTTTTQNTSNVSNAYNNNENASKLLPQSTSICCPQHYTALSLVPFPIRRSTSYQSTHFSPTEPRSRQDTGTSLRKKSLVAANQDTANSLPNLTTDANADTDIPSSIIKPPFDLAAQEPKKSRNSSTNMPNPSSSLPNTNQEDILIKNISSLLKNYSSSRKSIPTSSHTTNNDETLKDDFVSSSSLASQQSDISNQFSSVIETDEFNKLLTDIKTIVDNKLSIKTSSNVNHQTSSSVPMKTSSRTRRHKLWSNRAAASLEEASHDQFNEEHLIPRKHKRKLLISSKSQSFDETNLNLLSPIQSELNTEEAIF